MTITTSQETKLNNSMRAAQDVSLGTIIKELQGVASGSVVVSAVHTNASAVTIVPPIATLHGAMVQVFRGGSATFNPYKAQTNGSLIFTANTAGSYALTAGDVFNWMAF